MKYSYREYGGYDQSSAGWVHYHYVSYDDFAMMQWRHYRIHRGTSLVLGFLAGLLPVVVMFLFIRWPECDRILPACLSDDWLAFSLGLPALIVAALGGRWIAHSYRESRGINRDWRTFRLAMGTPENRYPYYEDVPPPDSWSLPADWRARLRASRRAWKLKQKEWDRRRSQEWRRRRQRRRLK